MMQLHSDWAYLEQEFGCSVRERFLMAVRSLDNPKAVTPFLLERDGQRFGLFMHVEKGNVEAARLPPDIKPVYYRPYFSFEASERAPHVHATVVDALESVADGQRRISVDLRAPMSLATELASRFDIDMERAPRAGTVTLRKAPCSATLQLLGQGRPAAAKAAQRLLDRSPSRDRLLPYLQRHDDPRFTTLDAAMQDAGLAALVVSSTLNMQEVGGVPVAAKQRPLAVVYLHGDSNAWIIEPGRTRGEREFATPEGALHHLLPNGVIGVETEDVGLGLARDLGLDKREHRPADRLIRQWRDLNVLPDLPYYVIATRITRHAIDAALAFADEAIQSSTVITEMDPYAVYLQSMRDFATAALPGSRVARTLTNFHTGARTIFPANAAPWPVNRASNTLKIDAGCLLFDSSGVLLGCSDIARTLPLSEDARELYDVFQHGVRHTLIPGLAPGRTGDEVHAEGSDVVWSQRDRFRDNALFVDLADPATEYDRDVGHLLGKNNLAHLRLVHGDRQPLREGTVACCEYQWPVRGNAVAYEDTCLVANDRGLNLTSDEE
jgi:Xaa-Pro aminopeptidase